MVATNLTVMYLASYKASQMFWFEYNVLENKTFEKPYSRPQAELWITVKHSLMSAVFWTESRNGLAPQYLYYNSKGMCNSRVVILIYVVKEELRAFAHLWTLTLQLQLPDMENSPFFIPHPFSLHFLVTIKGSKILEYVPVGWEGYARSGKIPKQTCVCSYKMTWFWNVKLHVVK